MAEISQEELNERVALLRRFRSLLEQQRGKFQEYLNVLEKQQDSITSENPENLLAHTEGKDPGGNWKQDKEPR